MREDIQARYNRIALAQLSFNPAYVDPSGISDIHEPAFPSESQFQGLHRIADVPEIAELRAYNADAYLRHIRHKIQSVAEFAASKGVEVLVLPEYSVPPETMETCRDLATRLRMVIVAGSHTVTQTAMDQYRRLGISPAGGIGRAACPVFGLDGKCTLFEKLTRSKWESEMLPGSPVGPLSIPFPTGTVRLQVMICIDAIQDPGPDQKRSFRASVPTFLAIPALTPELTLFNSKAALVLASGRCVLLANAAEFGGSRLYARADRTAAWLGAADGTAPLQKGAEALVIADVDIAHQYDIRQSTNEFFPVRGVSIYPLVYDKQSDICNRYAAFQKHIQVQTDLDLDEARRVARTFVGVDRRELPSLLQEKLRHFLDHVDSAGLADRSAWSKWIDAIIVSSTESTTALRARLCSKAISVVTQTALLGRNPSKVGALTDAYTYLAKRYAEIVGELPTSSTPPSAPPESSAGAEGTATFEPPFFNRESLLDTIRKTVESRNAACHLFAGMRGIGKSSFAREVLKKVIVPSWKRIWVQITEGMSFARLLAELAYRLDLTVPDDSPGDDIGIADLAQNVLLAFTRTPRIAIVLDDFQYLLGPDREFLDVKAKDFTVRLLRGALDKHNVIFITTTHYPIWSEDVQKLVDTNHIVRLDDKNAERLFSFWLRVEQGELGDVAFTVPENVLALVRGHPLALKLAARMWAERPQADLTLFRQVRETIVPYILDQVTLSSHEEEFLRYASIFRVPVRREAFVRWKADAAVGLLDSLLGRSLLEIDGDTYQLHPLVRDHYYSFAGLNELRPLHKLAGMYFLDSYREARAARAPLDPEIVAEAVHHLLCAGERDKVREFGLYRHELRPVALMHYRKQSYDVASREYRLLVELDPDDHDAHFHLALIYSNDDKWNEAEAHFGKAMRLKPRGYWVLQSYAHVMLRKNRDLPRAEQLLKQAEGFNPSHSYTLVDLARLMARTERGRDAETYFLRAIEGDGDNTRAYYEYAKFLRYENRLDEALNMAQAALESNPADHQNKALVRELRQRVESADSSSASN
jgi:tetratricopeptide (TPR) repeat protein/predicted amidohydrolase